MRMKEIKWLVLLLILAMVMTSCGYKSYKKGAAISEGKVEDFIVDGKTTKQDVLLEFGVPTSILDEEKVFFYTWTKGSKTRVGLYGGKKSYTRNLVILFDDQGIVKSHRITTTEAESQKSLNEGDDERGK
ncbi:MAG: hypothetical protein JXA41_00290 [Deltaproteobacteria bacterium]|nr:hypothetical protein [Deltaproteobacteria bacterium]